MRIFSVSLIIVLTEGGRMPICQLSDHLPCKSGIKILGRYTYCVFSHLFVSLGQAEKNNKHRRNVILLSAVVLPL